MGACHANNRAQQKARVARMLPWVRWGVPGGLGAGNWDVDRGPLQRVKRLLVALRAAHHPL